MIKKILIGLACIVLAGLLVWGIQRSRQEDAARSAALREVNEQMDSLRSRKLELEKELEALKKEISTKVGGMGTISLLITDLDSAFVARISLSMDEAAVPGVLVLTEEQFPGNEECITLSRFQELLESGWEYCLAWNGIGDFDSWYASMSELLRESNLSMPKALYCEDRSYREDLESAAQEKGFAIIIHSGELGLSIINEEAETPWRIGSTRWASGEGRNYVDQAAYRRGSVALIIDQINFFEEEFSAMLRLINRYLEAETLLPATLTAAKSYRTKIVSQLEDAQYNSSNSEKVRAMEEELESVNAQIQALIESR